MNSWSSFFEVEEQKSYYQMLFKLLKEERTKYHIFPKEEDLFKAFELCPLNKLKMVILGQDPYHEVNQAHGLAFSVPNGFKMPPSLRNIFKELVNEFHMEMPTKTDLSDIACEGVLLLNTILTVREGEALSHQNIGWLTFSENVIKYINTIDQPIVYLLLGNYAKGYERLITNPHHLVLKTSHPSPLSANHGFFGSQIFIKANEFLKNNHIEEINWHILNS